MEREKRPTAGLDMGKMESLARLAEMAGGEVVGDPEVIIQGVNDLALAGANEITFISHPKMVEQANASRAGAVIIPSEVDDIGKPAIRVREPYLAIAIIHNHFLDRPFRATGIHPQSYVGRDCQISAEVSIHPMTVIGDRVKIGARVTIHPGVAVGNDVVIDDDCVLHANVTLYHGSRLGKRVIIHSGTVIGSDGFGYATDEKGWHHKRPHVGVVEIEDDVEVGANVCIDRATFGKTIIKRGAKIDNLVQVGHNVIVGESSLLVSQVGISGSTSLGRGVVLGGQTGVAGHLHLGDRVMVGAKSGIHNSQPAGAVISGYPAFSHKKWLRAVSAFPNLPELIKDVRTLQKKIETIFRKLHPAGGQDQDEQ